MGVPAFFRWLSRRCGAIVVNCVEEEPKTVDGVTIPGQSPNLRFLFHFQFSEISIIFVQPNI